MINLANSNQVGLVVKGRQGGVDRGYRYNGTSIVPNNVFQADAAGETITPLDLRNAAAAGNELTWTVVPPGSQTRIGIDRDEDGFFDRDEITGCGDPADAAVGPTTKGDIDESGVVDEADVAALVGVLLSPGTSAPHVLCAADMNGDGTANAGDIGPFSLCLTTGLCP
jgi:hypothetical protein